MPRGDDGGSPGADRHRAAGNGGDIGVGGGVGDGIAGGSAGGAQEEGRVPVGLGRKCAEGDRLRVFLHRQGFGSAEGNHRGGRSILDDIRNGGACGRVVPLAVLGSHAGVNRGVVLGPTGIVRLPGVPVGVLAGRSTPPAGAVPVSGARLRSVQPLPDALRGAVGTSDPGRGAHLLENEGVFRGRGDVDQISGNSEEASAGGSGAGRGRGDPVGHHLIEPPPKGDGVAQGDVDRPVRRRGVGGRKGHRPQRRLIGRRIAGTAQGKDAFGRVIAAGDPRVAGAGRQGQRVPGLQSRRNLHLGGGVGSRSLVHDGQPGIHRGG